MPCTHENIHAGLRRNPALFHAGSQMDAFQLAREYLELCDVHPTPDCFIKNHLFKLLGTVEGGFNDYVCTLFVCVGECVCVCV